MERLCVTGIEHELRFIDWRNKNNINYIFFDLDDTLCNTSKVYDEKIRDCVSLIAGNKFDKEKVNADFHKINNRLYETNSVNPDKYKNVVRELKNIWKFNENLEAKAINILSDTFTTPYKLYDGVSDTLGFLNKTDTGFGIVTHANREWTWKKYNWFGLDKFIDWDDVFIVGENRHKTAESWQEAGKYFAVNPMTTMVVGDSPRTDMCASKVGYKHLYLVGPKDKKWVVFNAELPFGVKEISSVNEIIHLGCCGK